MNSFYPNSAGNAELSQKMRRTRLLIFIGIVVPYLISYFQRSAPAVAGPEIMAEMGLAPAALGVLVSMYALGYAAAQLPAGVLADTWGARKTMSSFVLIAAAGSVIFALSPDLAFLSFGRFLVGMGVGFVYVPGVRAMTEWYRPDELGTYSGILLGAGSAGAIFSAAPLVLMMDAVGWRHSFLIVAAITVAAAFYCWLTVRDSPAEMGLPPLCRPVDQEEESAEAGSKSIAGLKAVFSNGQFYLLGILLFCYYGTVLGIGSLWAGPFLRQACGLSAHEAGNVITMVPLGMAIGCPLSGYLSDKVLKSRKKVLAGGAFLHALCYPPLIAFMGELPMAALYAIFLWFGLTGGAFVISFVCSKETVEPRFAGAALGAINVFTFTGGAFFQAVLGMVIGRRAPISEGVYSMAAYNDALLVSLGSLLAGAAAFLFFKEGTRAKSEDACAGKYKAYRPRPGTPGPRV